MPLTQRWKEFPELDGIKLLDCNQDLTIQATNLLQQANMEKVEKFIQATLLIDLKSQKDREKKSALG